MEQTRRANDLETGTADQQAGGRRRIAALVTESNVVRREQQRPRGHTDQCVPASREVLADERAQQLPVVGDMFQHVEQEKQVEGCARPIDNELKPLAIAKLARSEHVRSVAGVPADNLRGRRSRGELRCEPGIACSDIEHPADRIESHAVLEHSVEETKTSLFPGMAGNRSIGQFDEVHGRLACVKRCRQISRAENYQSRARPCPFRRSSEVHRSGCTRSAHL